MNNINLLQDIKGCLTKKEKQIIKEFLNKHLGIAKIFFLTIVECSTDKTIIYGAYENMLDNTIESLYFKDIVDNKVLGIFLISLNYINTNKIPVGNILKEKYRQKDWLFVEKNKAKKFLEP